MTDQKKERKPSAWLQALKAYNAGKSSWAMPRKGTAEYEEVRKLMGGGAPVAAPSVAAVAAPAQAAPAQAETKRRTKKVAVIPAAVAGVPVVAPAPPSTPIAAVKKVTKVKPTAK